MRFNPGPTEKEHDEDCDKFGCFFCERNYDCVEGHECECWEALHDAEDRKEAREDLERWQNR